VPIRTFADVVGRYRSVTGARAIEIEEKGEQLVVRGYGTALIGRLEENGTLAVQGHYSARLIQRGARTLLCVDWTYETALYEPVDH
jgi:hypothetical protein